MRKLIFSCPMNLRHWWYWSIPWLFWWIYIHWWSIAGVGVTSDGAWDRVIEGGWRLLFPIPRILDFQDTLCHVGFVFKAFAATLFLWLSSHLSRIHRNIRRGEIAMWRYFPSIYIRILKIAPASYFFSFLRDRPHVFTLIFDEKIAFTFPCQNLKIVFRITHNVCQ